jgi:hypothetical protein
MAVIQFTVLTLLAFVYMELIKKKEFFLSDRPSEDSKRAPL